LALLPYINREGNEQIVGKGREIEIRNNVALENDTVGYMLYLMKLFVGAFTKL
jgi:hypothetical protein